MTGHNPIVIVQQVWRQLTEKIDGAIRPDSPVRKVIQLVSVILLVEGLSVLLLFSYVGVLLGIVSLLAGSALVLLFFRVDRSQTSVLHESMGLRLMSLLERIVGGVYSIMVVGAVLIMTVIIYNVYASDSPEYGDVDTLCMMFGGLLLIYPLLPVRFKVETTFSTIFLGFVVLFLAVPQALVGIGSGGGTTSIGNWYVHYMLAAPFATLLDVIGIPASSAGSFVTIQFSDGSLHTLEISTYCAGLYSFSIFISAFFSYVLVFEMMRNRTLIGVLGLGLVVAYFGNLLRMVIIGVIGHYWGIESLRWAHENVGWIIFISWSALFWWLILGRYAERHESP